MEPTNAYAVTARQIKAAKMAEVLIAHGATAADVHAMPLRGRAIVAELAGTRPPSPLTWVEVAERVAAARKVA